MAAPRHERAEGTKRSFGPVLTVAMLLAHFVFAASARAEVGDDLVCLLVLPLAGPGGAKAQASIVARLEGKARALGASPIEAKQPAKALRRRGAKALITGRIRCPAKRCVVELSVLRRNGKVWSRGQRSSSRAKLSGVASELAEELLSKLGLLKQRADVPDSSSVAATEGSDVPDSSSVAATEASSAVVETRPGQEMASADRPRSARANGREAEGAHEAGVAEVVGEGAPLEPHEEQPVERHRDRFKAIEMYLTSGGAGPRRLCLDLEGGDDVCNADEPEPDDRVHRVIPYGSVGGELIIFPGAFGRKQSRWSHLGVYAAYNRGLGVRAWRDYVASSEHPIYSNQVFTAQLDAHQQDVRAGLVRRVPGLGPRGSQLRLSAGYLFWQFYIDDDDYPEDAHVDEEYRETNPMLPTFAYSLLEIGAEYRLQPHSRIWINNAVSLGTGFGVGQAQRVFGASPATFSIEYGFELIVELGAGMRADLVAEVRYLSTRFGGGQDLDDDELEIWGETGLGDRASDLAFRYLLGIGWSY